MTVVSRLAQMPALMMVAVGLLGAADLSRYREYRLGMSLPAVTQQTKVNSTAISTLHQRPELIQELQWHPQPSHDAPTSLDSVDTMLFSFYNGALFRIVVTYDESRTAGLTPGDMADRISADLGTPTRPTEEILLPSLVNRHVKVLARWQDAEHSWNLVETTYPPQGLGLVILAKRVDLLARAATDRAVRLDAQEAPQRERAAREQEAEKQERARQANKPGFRP